MAEATLIRPGAGRRPRTPVRRPPTPRRLGIVVALVVSMMLTLFARLYYVQLLDPHKPTQTAQATHDGAIVLTAPRGQIVDAQGRVLVGNTTVETITVTRDTLQRRADKGQAVLVRLGALLGTSAATLAKEITPCSPKVSAPCSTGEPYAPVTVATKVATKVVNRSSAITGIKRVSKPGLRRYVASGEIPRVQFIVEDAE